MTPCELHLYAEVFSEKLQREQDEKITLVWMGEYFHRIEKLPPLKEILDKGEKKTMTNDEMLEMAKRLNNAFGGKEKKAGE